MIYSIKNKYLYIFPVIILIIITSFLLLSKKNSRINIEKIKKSIVTIIPETKLIDFKNNPSWILGYKNNWWIWLGFFIDNSWKILTAYHLVNNDEIKYTIKTYDNKEYIWEIIYIDPKNDIAELKIKSQINYKNLDIIKDYSNTNIWNNIISFWLNIDNFNINYLKWKITNINKVNNIIEFEPKISKWFSGWPLLNEYWYVIWINSSIDNTSSYSIKLPSVFLQ